MALFCVYFVQFLRIALTSTEAVAEMRRVAGTHLDPQLVEEFVALLDAKGLRFRHADDADFEAELDFERRVREYARRAPGLRVAVDERQLRH